MTNQGLANLLLNSPECILSMELRNDYMAGEGILRVEMKVTLDAVAHLTTTHSLTARDVKDETEET